MSEQQLQEIRKKIDGIDKAIYQLLKDRAQVAVEVAQIKKQSEQEPVIYYRPEREAQILRRIMADNDSLLSDRAVAQVFRDIMTACLAVQKQLNVAYLGPEGTFSQMATEAHFGRAITATPVDSIERVFREVEAGNADYGIVPIENSTEGIVNITLDGFLNSCLQICGEIEIPIHQNLMRAQNATVSITKVYSHQQSLGQCRKWLTEHLPQAEIIAVKSNGLAAQMASQELDSAAIGAAIAAEKYELDIVTPNIEDNSQNTTRFLIIGQQVALPSGNDKTSLLIPSPHIPGSLYNLLKPFADRGINLSLLESRPYRHRNWSYVFFMDLLGHKDDENIKAALAELAEMSVMVTVLGSYPRAVI